MSWISWTVSWKVLDKLYCKFDELDKLDCKLGELDKLRMSLMS